MAEMKAICGRIKEFRVLPCQLPLEFDKDDMVGGHVDFVAAAANLRARVFGIPEGEKREVKRLAGAILPAIATVTATVCGFMALEGVKVLLGERDHRRLRSGFVNLAQGSIAQAEREPARIQTCEGNGRAFIEAWEHWVLDGDMTIAQLAAALEAQFGLRLGSLLVGQILVRCPFLPAEHFAAFDGMTISEIWVREAKLALPRGRCMLQVHPELLNLSGTVVRNMPDIYVRMV